MTLRCGWWGYVRPMLHHKADNNAFACLRPESCWPLSYFKLGTHSRSHKLNTKTKATEPRQTQIGLRYMYVLFRCKTSLRPHYWIMNWAVDATGLIITSGTCCGQEDRSVNDTSGGRSGTQSCWSVVDQTCVDSV